MRSAIRVGEGAGRGNPFVRIRFEHVRLVGTGAESKVPQGVGLAGRIASARIVVRDEKPRQTASYRVGMDSLSDITAFLDGVHQTSEAERTTK